MKHLQLFENFLNESDSLLKDINDLDQFFMHKCKDKKKSDEFEREAEDILGSANTSNWKDAISVDENPVRQLVVQWKDEAIKCGMVAESLSPGKASKKEEKYMESFAVDKKNSDEEFISEFGFTYPSAAELWMNENDIKKLRKLVASAKYVFVSLSGESADGTLDSRMEEYTSKGWKMFADEQNDDNYDSILYKNK